VSEVRAVVATGQGKPVEVTTIVVPDPGPDEVAVDVRACGICPADLRYRDDGVDGEFPMLLGHEVAGTVAAVGVGVHHVEPGDLVVLDWRAVCGTCRACRRGRPQRCCDTPTADQPMTLTDGTPLSTALGIGGFAERTLVHAAQCTKAGPAWRPAVAGLLGCGVLAGFGAAVYTAPTGPGDSVAILGCGEVGVGAVAGAVMAGARRIVVVDTDPRKLDRACRFGATHTVNAARADTVEAVRALTGGDGADVVIDTVGTPESYTHAFYARDLAGTVVLAGVPGPTTRLELPLPDVLSRGGALKASRFGDCLPERDLPMMAELYLQGRLPLEKLATEKVPLEEVEAAFDRMHRGDVLRSVVTF